jgi:hypothetical protein
MAHLTASTERERLLDADGFPQGNEYDWDNYGPAGIHHVFLEGARLTVCGQSLDELYQFPFRGTPMDTTLLCAECEQAAP